MPDDDRRETREREALNIERLFRFSASHLKMSEIPDRGVTQAEVGIIREDSVPALSQCRGDDPVVGAEIITEWLPGDRSRSVSERLARSAQTRSDCVEAREG